MTTPYSLFSSTSSSSNHAGGATAAPLTPPFSPADAHQLVRRTMSRISLDSIETFTLDESECSGDEDEDDEEEGGEESHRLGVVQEIEVDQSLDKGIGGMAKLRVAIVTGAWSFSRLSSALSY